MSPSEEKQVIDQWNRYHSISEISDYLAIPQTEVRDVLNKSKGKTLYLE